MSIRLLLVDDHPVVRAGLRALLEREVDIEVVGEADGGAAAITLARKLRPNLVVTDLLLPDVDGVAVTETIRSELPATHVIILTSATEDDAAVLRALRAGAIGYVLKDLDVELLVKTIRSAGEGQVRLSPRAAARLMEEVRAPRSRALLTDRQLEVLRQIAVGRTNKEIAQSLHLGLSTVKCHVRTILDKLEVDSRTQAALQALRSQIVPADILQLDAHVRPRR